MNPIFYYSLEIRKIFTMASKTGKQPAAPSVETPASNTEPAKLPARETKWRSRTNNNQFNEQRSEIYSIYFGNHTSVGNSINRIDASTGVRAKQISVSSRGIGFAVVESYKRILSTWSIEQLWPICTIHQFYRVGLALYHYALYLAQQEQRHVVAGPPRLANILMDEEWRQLLSTVGQTTVVLASVLKTIGLVSTKEGNYHCGIIRFPGDNVQNINVWRTLSLSIDSLRNTVVMLGQPQLLQFRQFFQEHNHIPGATWHANHTLANGDEIMPAVYGIDDLRNDVNAYNALLTRVVTRVPDLIVELTLSGKGTQSALISTDISAANIVTTYRAWRGHDIEGVPQPILDTIRIDEGYMVDYWSPEEVTSPTFALGACSHVGEIYDVTDDTLIRRSICGRAFYSVDPFTTMSAMLNPPHSKVVGGAGRRD